MPTSRLLFLSIVVLELAHAGTAILLHRVPSGHDGFQYFTLQYFFLNARRFFDVPTVFFVAIRVVGSCVWLDQPYWNFRLYYAIPLVLDLPYFIPVVSFAVFAYFAFYIAMNHRPVWERLGRLEWRWRALFSVFFSALSSLPPTRA